MKNLMKHTRTFTLSSPMVAGCLLIALLWACSNDNEEDLFGEPACGTEAISLADDIQPIIAANCAVPGCHVSGAQAPDFTSKDNIIARAASIRTRTGNRTMPPAASGRSLSDTQIQQISCWVESGAADN